MQNIDLKSEIYFSEYTALGLFVVRAQGREWKYCFFLIQREIAPTSLPAVNPDYHPCRCPHDDVVYESSSLRKNVHQTEGRLLLLAYPRS